LSRTASPEDRQDLRRADALASHQRALVALGREALLGSDLETVFQRAAELVASVLDVEFAKVLELLPGGSELLLRAGVGWREGLVGRATVGAGRDSQAGYTLRSNEPVIVADLREEKRFSGPALLVEHRVVSGASVIIPGQERPFGVLGAHTVRARVFSADEVDFMLCVASMLAFAVADFRRAETERYKFDFLRLASHELRGPVAVARGYLSMVEDGSIDPASETYRDVVRTVSEKLSEMDYVIDEMLEAGRAEGRQVALKLVTFDLCEVVREVVRGAALQSRRHRIDVRLPSHPVAIRADRVRIANVAGHLVDNAIKYSPDGGNVTCRVWATPGQAFLAVEDEGIGIAEEDVESLFQYFSRVRNAATDQIPGTGLGLALSRQVARLHGGDVTVESEAGRGSRFTLALPIAPGLDEILDTLEIRT
jgi:signal transduction histidine kinase